MNPGQKHLGEMGKAENWAEPVSERSLLLSLLFPHSPWLKPCIPGVQNTRDLGFPKWNIPRCRVYPLPLCCQCAPLRKAWCHLFTTPGIIKLELEEKPSLQHVKFCAAVSNTSALCLLRSDSSCQCFPIGRCLLYAVCFVLEELWGFFPF